MKNLLIIFAFLNILASATAQVYNRPLSEAQTFYIPSDAVNNDVVGTVLAYPEFHNVGTAPMFSLRTNVDNIYAVSSTGVITISNNSALGTGDDVITVTIGKSGYASYDINVTITCISVASNTFFIDPSSGTNGAGTRANPKNAIPDVNSYTGYKYWFKRGTTTTVLSTLSMVDKTNKYFCSYGQGAKAKIVGNGIRIFWASSGCSNIRFSELEITAASPATDGSNWLTQPIYFTDSNGAMEVSHCTTSYGQSGIGTGVSSALPGLLLAFNTVHHTKYDGCYIQRTTSYTNIIGNYVYSVNWAYQFSGTDEGTSGGDCIQFSAADKIIARGNYVDHSLFGNKFCIIVEDGSNNRYTAQVTDNYCLAPSNNSGIYVQGYVTGTKVSRNYVQGGVQGISYGGGGGTIQIDYNIIKSTDRGIYAGTSNIYNNVFNDCATGIYNHTSGYPAKNNIFFFTSSSQIAYNSAGNAAYDHNLYSDQHSNMFGSGRNTIAGQTGEDNSVAGNPLFFSQTDFHLQSGSPAIGKGLAVAGLTTDFSGNTAKSPPSIGAYESGSSALPPPPAPSTPPAFQNAVVESASSSILQLTYNLSLSGTKVPPITAYSVLINGTISVVNTVAVAGTKVQLTLPTSIKFGDVVIVSYIIPASNPLQSESGGIAASFSSKPVTNNIASPTKDVQPVTVSMAISPYYIHTTINVAFKYSTTPTSVQLTGMTPQILKITDTYGKLFVEKLLVTGTTTIKFPINLRRGIYNVILLTNGVNTCTKKVMIY